MKTLRLSILFFLALGFCGLCISSSNDAPAGKKILVVMEDDEIKSSHSIFFKYLTEREYKIDYAEADDRNIKFRKYGEWQYDHLILFAPSASDIVGISSDDVLEFIDSGRNVIVAADSNIGDIVREIASECNIEFDEEETSVIDHFNYDISDSEHTLIVAEPVSDAPSVLSINKAPVLFRGVGQDIEEDSELLFPLLTGYATTYSHSSSKPVKELHVAGKKTTLVTALQARNNARVIFSGSVELFGDAFINSKVQKVSFDGKDKKFDKSGNADFVKQITSWVLQERGVLRVKNANTHRVGDTVAPYAYTIKQDVVYSIEIEEWKDNAWVAYSANDVQLEYRMLDPYVRTNLKNVGNGKYSVNFILPDVYGVFTFKVEYNRRGLSNLNSIIRIPVRPFRHNEYERFIASAFPYYASAFSMMGGLFVFSWFFLYHREK